jgi:hypothetical protein
MQKIIIAILGIACSSSSFALNAVCPAASDIKYSNNTYTPPAGWSVAITPNCTDNTPTKWIETSWGTSRFNSNHIECAFQVKGYFDNSGCGSLILVSNQPSSDPWYMPNRPAGWIDQGSHQTYPKNPWDFCQYSTGGTRLSCLFPNN